MTWLIREENLADDFADILAHTGLAVERDPSEFDQQELAKGIKVEKEHINDTAIATQIAMDHLVEDPKYYSKLATIETPKNEAIIVDIDDTIADSSHRQKYKDAEDWDTYDALAKNDPLKTNIWKFIKDKYPNEPIYLFTGRSERIRDVTKAWLKKHGIQYAGLAMRPASEIEHIPNHELKQQYLDRFIIPKKIQIKAAFDDNENTIEMYQSNNIKTYKVKK